MEGGFVVEIEIVYDEQPGASRRITKMVVINRERVTRSTLL